jgi:glutathione S-transferase
MVPVIQDGDFVLWESNAICRYLAGTQPRATLLPQDPRLRAQVEQWMDWQATELNNSWRYAFLALTRRHPEYTQAKEIADSLVSWHRHMRMLDARHPGYEFTRHKGYGTPLHLARLRAHGPCPIHRRSFFPVQQALFPFA